MHLFKKIQLLSFLIIVNDYEELVCYTINHNHSFQYFVKLSLMVLQMYVQISKYNNKIGFPVACG